MIRNHDIPIEVRTALTLFLIFAFASAPASGQAGGAFDLSWNTIDGGGATFSSGGTFSLGATIGQADAGALAGGAFTITGGFWPAAATPIVGVNIISANPPAATGNPYAPGQPYRDVLDTGTTAALTAGIGGGGTVPQGGVQYAQISVTFSGTPSPAPSTGNIGVACTGGNCPSVTSVSGSGTGPYTVALSGVIPPTHCTTLTFAGTNAGQKLQYQSLPGDVNLDGTSNTVDLLALVTALNNGTANLAGNLARYNIDRMGGVNTQDLLRLVQLLNGVNTTQVFNGATAAACP
ncbi:MAG TPA: hypothetical protein VGM03_06325 [Phycisphaerae bacterium]